MEAPKKKPKIIIVAVIAVIAVLLIIGGAVYAFIQVGSEGDKKPAETTQKVDTDDNKTEVTQQSLNQSVSDLNETTKKSQVAHDAAKKAVNDQSKRVKVSE